MGHQSALHGRSGSCAHAGREGLARHFSRGVCPGLVPFTPPACLVAATPELAVRAVTVPQIYGVAAIAKNAIFTSPAVDGAIDKEDSIVRL